MCKQMDSIQAVNTACGQLNDVLQRVLNKQEAATSNGTVRAIRQAFYASPVTPENMKDTLRKIK